MSVLSNQPLVKVKREFQSNEAIQIVNQDGTTTLRVQQKSLYFHDIANELHNTYQDYSDVKIVCGDGGRFNANKSILSRSKYLSEYLQIPEIPSGERAWLFIPDVTSSMMKTALQWFYDNSRDLKYNESLDILKNLFGIDMLETSENVISPDFNEKEAELSTLEDKDEWSLFCEKDSSSGLYNCPLCEATAIPETEVKLHIQSHGLEILQCEVMKCSKSSSTIESQPDNLVSQSGNFSKEQTFQTRSKFVCYLCKKTFETKNILYRHVAWRHFKEKVLFLSQRLCQEKSCFPKNGKLSSWAAHLAIKHKALKSCMTDQEFLKLRRKIFFCSYCQKQVSQRYISRHEMLCLQRKTSLELEVAYVDGFDSTMLLPESGSEQQKRSNCSKCNQKPSKNHIRHAKFCQNRKMRRKIKDKDSSNQPIQESPNKKETGVSSAVKDVLEDGDVTFQEKSVANSTQPLFQSQGDTLHPIILKPYALNCRLNEKAFTDKYIENQEYNVGEIQSWNSNVRMDAKSGNVYVMRGKIGLTFEISKADNYIWKDKGSTRTPIGRYRRFQATCLKTSDTPIVPVLRKRITFMSQISIYIVHYTEVENVNSEQHETFEPDCLEMEPSGITTKEVGIPSLKTETEESLDTIINHGPLTNPHILTPFATDQWELTSQFWNDITLNCHDDLQVFTQNTTLEAKDGNIFIFSGQLFNVSLIKNADGLRWNSAGCRLTDDFRFFYYKESSSRAPLRKRLVYNNKTSIFVAFYHKSRNFPSPSRVVGNRGCNTTSVCSEKTISDEIHIKEESLFEDNNLNMEEVTEPVEVQCVPLEPEIGLITSPTLSPYFTNVSKIDMSNRGTLMHTKKDGLQEWTSNMQLDSQVGNVYVFTGSQDNFHEILHADCFRWRRTGSALRGNLKNDFCSAKLNPRLLTDEQKKLLGGKIYYSDLYRKSSLRKRISFNTETSVYFVHYFEKGPSLPSVKRPQKDSCAQDSPQVDIKLDNDEMITQDPAQCSENETSLVDFSSLPVMEPRKRLAHQSQCPRKKFRSEDQAALKTRETGTEEDNNGIKLNHEL